MEKQPVTVRVSEGFVLLLAGISLVFGALVFFGLHPGLRLPPLAAALSGICALAGAVVLALLFWGLRRRTRLAFYGGIALLSLLFLLTFLDELGWADTLFLLLVLVPLGMLIRDRKWYLRA